jgi:hypothetical protein
VQTGAHLQAEPSKVLGDRASRPHAARRSVERGQKSIAGGVNFSAAEMHKPLADEGVVRVE